ncbi:MAG: polysaccharide biosynthesis tyrosine autokinase [Candidatus Omnitrophota bacterium]
MADPQFAIPGHMPEIHLEEYLPVILRRRRLILTFFTVVVTLVGIGTLTMKPVYESKSTIQIEKSGPRVTSIQEVAPQGGASESYGGSRDYYYETQYKLLLSPTLLKRVIDALGLYSDQESKRKIQDPVKELRKFVRVKPIRNSQLVEIAVRDTDPKQAAKITTELVDEYVRLNFDRNIKTTGAAAEWLTKKIDEQRRQLVEAEQALQKYREANKIEVLPQVRLGGEQAAEDVKTEFAKAQALLDSYTERYTEEHPKMIELRSQILSLKNKIQGMEGVDAGNKTSEYRALEREVDTSQRMYDVLLARLREVDVTSTINISNITVIDRAEVPLKPVKPRVLLNMLLAVVFGLFGGVGLAFFIDYMDTTIKSPQDIREALESRFLGSVPELDERILEMEKDKFTHLQPSAPMSEHFRHIRTEVLSLLPEGADLKAFVVTSPDPQAGKTMTSSNFAIVMSQCGSKVLFVDADMRKPQLHKVFNLNRHDGLSEYLTSAVTFRLTIQDPGIEGLKVVTAGNSVPNPAELIGSKKMSEFIAEAKKMFDFVIFDTPPVISVTDAVVLAGMTDASILVVRSGKILAPGARSAKDKLTGAKKKFLGVVLNGMKPENSDLGYYQYYHSYSYYGEDGRRRSASGAKVETFKDKLQILKPAPDSKDSWKDRLTTFAKSLFKDKAKPRS